MSVKITENDFPKIARIYNAKGKSAAYTLIRNHYGVKNPSCVFKRLKNSKELYYDYEADLFEIKEEITEDVFLTLDELCESKAIVSSIEESAENKNNRSMAMEKMINALIRDRLMELTKFITLDPFDRNITIYKTAMEQDNYTVILN